MPDELMNPEECLHHCETAPLGQLDVQAVKECLRIHEPTGVGIWGCEQIRQRLEAEIAAQTTGGANVG